MHLARSSALTLEWLAALGPLAHDAIRSLPPVLVEAASFALTGTPGGEAGAVARIFVGDTDEDWFPAHARLDVCPRGHPFVSGTWNVDELTPRHRRIADVEPVLVISADSESYEYEPGGPWFFLVCEHDVGLPHRPRQGTWRRGAGLQRLWYPVDSSGRTRHTCMARWKVAHGTVEVDYE